MVFQTLTTHQLNDAASTLADLAQDPNLPDAAKPAIAALQALLERAEPGHAGGGYRLHLPRALRLQSRPRPPAHVAPHASSARASGPCTWPSSIREKMRALTQRSRGPCGFGKSQETGRVRPEHGTTPCRNASRQPQTAANGAPAHGGGLKNRPIGCHPRQIITPRAFLTTLPVKHSPLRP